MSDLEQSYLSVVKSPVPPSRNGTSDTQDVEVPTKLLLIKRAANIIITVGAVVLCGVSLYPIVCDYFAFGTNVDVSVNNLRSIRDVLPGLTICHNSLISINDLQRKVKPLKKELKAIAKEQNVTEDIKYQKLFKATSKAIDQLFVDKPLGDYFKEKLIKSKEFIAETDCDLMTWKRPGAVTLWGVEQTRRYDIRATCTNVHKVRTIQNDSMCFTLFSEIGLLAMDNSQPWPRGPYPGHGGWGLDETLTKSKEEILAMMGGNYEPPIFRTNQMVTIVLNFKEHSNLAKSRGGKLLVHHNRIVASSMVGGFYLKPGLKYTIYLKRTRTQNKRPPYTTNCRNYTGDYVRELLDKNFTMNANLPLSREVSDRDCDLENCALLTNHNLDLH